MPKTNVYKAAGFTLLNKLDEGGLISYLVYDSINIAKGDAIHINATGYAVNDVATDISVKFVGIASHAANNASGTSGAISVLVIPPLRKYQFIVPVANALITQAAVGTQVDLSAVNTIDLTDLTGAADSLGLFIDEIDVSDLAIAANEFGYAIGHFVGHYA